MTSAVHIASRFYNLQNNTTVQELALEAGLGGNTSDLNHESNLGGT